VQALTVAVLSGKVKSVGTATEVIRAFCLLSYEFEFCPQLLDAQVILAILYLYRMGLVVPESAEMICLIIRNCSTVQSCREPLITNGGILLIRALFKPMVSRSIAITRSIIISLLELSREEDLHEAMVSHGAVELLYNVSHPVLGNRQKSDALFPISPDNPYADFVHNEIYEKAASSVKSAEFPLSTLDIERLAAACKNLSKTPSIHLSIVNGEFTTFVEKFIAGNIEEGSRADLAEALCNLSSSKNCKQKLVSMGAVPLLLSISKDTVMVATQTHCTLALGYLSEITVVGHGAVAALLELSASKEEHENPRLNSADAKAGQPADGTAGTRTDGATADGGMNSGDFATHTATGAAITDTQSGTAAATADGGKGRKDSVALKPADPANKSLRQMIKEGLLSDKNKQTLARGGTVVDGVLLSESSLESKQDDKGKGKKIGSKGMLVGRLRNLTSHDMNSADAIAREREGLHHDYSEYSYKIFDNSGSFGVEHGGIAIKHKTALPLPSINAGQRETEGEGQSQNRSSQLTKIAINMQPLDKDEQIMDLDAMAQALAQAEKEAEEREAQAVRDAEALQAEALLAAAGRNSPLGIVDEDGRSGLNKPVRSSKKSFVKGRTTLSPAQSKQVKTVTGAGAAWGSTSGAPLAGLSPPDGVGSPGASPSPSRSRRSTSVK
jgi:hypothetical protein